MKIIKILSKDTHSVHCVFRLKTSAGLVAGVLSFGCMDANADIAVSTSGAAGITTSGLYIDENINLNATKTTGVKADGNANISLSHGSIKNNAATAANAKEQIGISVTDNSHVSLTDTTVLMDPKTGKGAVVTANDMTGILVNSGSRVELDNSSVTLGGGAKGNNNRGIVASGDKSAVSLKNSSVQTTSWGAVGVAAEQGARVSLTDGTTILTTAARGSNGGSHGATVNGPGSQLHSENALINTVGGSAYGIKATESASLELKDTTIRTSGGYGHGVFIDGSSSATISGGLIQTTGKGATGLWVRSGGSVNLQDGTKIETSGAAVSAAAPLDNEKTLSVSHVLLASDDNTSVTGRDLHFTSAGASASAARAEDNAHISLFDSIIETIGAATSTTTTAALHAVSGGAISGAGLAVSVTGTNQGGSRAEGQNSSITLDDSTINVSGAGNAVNPTAAARALAGGTLSISCSAMTTSGQQSHGVSVEGADSRATVKNTRIEARGARSSGINMTDGATADVSGSKINVTALENGTGPWSPGILLQGAGSILNLSQSEVSTTQNTSYGISALSGSQLNVDASGISTGGNYSTGIAVANATASIVNTHVETSGNDNAMGIIADTGAVVSVTGGSVVTTGNGSPVQSNLTFPHAMAARNPGSFLSVEGTNLVTKGTQAYGVAVDDGGNASLKNVTVRTEGDNSAGLYAGIGAAKPGSVKITADNVAVETLGKNATGVFVGRKYKAETAEVMLSSATVNTHGDNAVGLWSEAGATLAAQNAVIRTQGAGATGALVSNSALLALENTGITVTGNQAFGVLAKNGGNVSGENTVVAARGSAAASLGVQGTDALPGKAVFESSVFTSEAGVGIEIGGHADIMLQNSRVTGRDHWLQVKNGAGSHPGNAQLDLSGTIVSGAATTEANAYSDVSMSNTSLWLMNGNSDLSTLTNNNSFINFSSPVDGQYKTLQVNLYHGENGTIGLNTHLFDDASATDKLVIDGGHADGSSNLRITNTDGKGALTHGNGIKVVDAINGGTTAIGTFSLLNKVKAGPYQYTLYRSSVDGSNEQAWYLRSHKDTNIPGNDIVIPPNKPDDETPTTPPGDKPGDKPVTPPPDDKPDEGKQPSKDNEGKGNTGGADPTKPAEQLPSVPDYRAETSLYQAFMQQALLYNRMLIDSLHERTGEQFASLENFKKAEDSLSMSWGRAIYKRGTQDLNGPESRFTLNAIQLGIDLYRKTNEEGRSDFAGITGNLGKMNSNVTHTDNEYAGRNALKSWGVGVYWTHFTPSGTYLDAVAQYNRFYVESSPRDITSVKTKGYGLAASLETGYPWQPEENVKRFIEPQAQMVYSTTKLDSLHDDAAAVNFGKGESLAGRLSLRFHQTWDHDSKAKNNDKESRTTVWLRPGILHDFRGKTRTEFSSQDGAVPFITNTTGTSGQIIAGGDHQFNKSVSLTGSMSYEKSLEGDSKNYGGIVGVKIKF
ncbi:MAG TPA: autotransporter outer membrane beta-barrel domain-containing protein [Buttiauxella sp.]|nr:autotransporter outer membrane beta-barrel domain-containing protein [Buttiauxella sp.]